MIVYGELNPEIWSSEKCRTLNEVIFVVYQFKPFMEEAAKGSESVELRQEKKGEIYKIYIFLLWYYHLESQSQN